MIRPLLAALLLAPPVTAQVISTGAPAADILLSQAIAEHRTFLTCSVLDPETHQAILQAWNTDRAAAIGLLADHKIGANAIYAFRDASIPENLIPAPDTPFEDVRQLCDATPDWVQRYAARDRTILAQRLPDVMP